MISFFYNIGFSDWLSIFGILITIFGTIIGTVLTFRYSSTYHIKTAGKGKEKWLVLEKVSHASRTGVADSSRLVLQKSSFKNAQGFIDISLNTNNNAIIINRYATIHSCIHSIFSPGKIIIQDAMTWEEKTKSNSFTYTIKAKVLDSIPMNDIDKKLKTEIYECRAIEYNFEYPEIYTGPRYKKRIIVFAAGIGIVSCKTEYINGDMDAYKLTKYNILKGSNDNWLPVNIPGNWWEYEISFSFGPNGTNICE